MSIQEQDMDTLCHALGISEESCAPYRNYFVADHDHLDLPSLKRLADGGLMAEADCPSWLEPSSRVFTATFSGKVAALKYLEVIA